MKYKIKISYKTGDSFGSEDCEDFLELEWDNLNIVKQNLQRIKEHYEYFEDDYFTSREDRVCPDWMLNNIQQFSIELLSDYGQIWKICPFWVGYFERLYGADIVLNSDSEMGFTIH